jgi:hypothetical protein
VRRGLAAGDGRGAVAAPAQPEVDDLEASELVALLPSLEAPDLRQLRDHEASHRARTEVLSAIDRALG